MVDEIPPRVLILAGPVERECVTGILHGSCDVVDSATTELPEVIVVVHPRPLASGHAEELAHRESAARPAVVVVGLTADDADLLLPTDFLPRELVLACRLLAQVVRLRRRLEEHAQQGLAWRQEAALDALTQLPNRRAWQEELCKRSEAARAGGQSLCVALVDLDHFKQVNDGWGHAAGDQLLISTGAALRHSLRQHDFVARLGGDEFGLLLSGLDATSAAPVIERVRAGLPSRIAQSTPHVTSVSIGYAVFDGHDAVTPETLQARADLARRLAKTQGRDRTVGS